MVAVESDGPTSERERVEQPLVVSTGGTTLVRIHPHNVYHLFFAPIPELLQWLSR